MKINPLDFSPQSFANFCRILNLRVKINDQKFTVSDLGDEAFYKIALAQRLQFEVTPETGDYELNEERVDSKVTDEFAYFLSRVHKDVDTFKTKTIFEVNSVFNSSAIVNEFHKSIRSNNKLNAVKIFKDMSGEGLKVSKDFVDGYWDDFKRKYPK